MADELITTPQGIPGLLQIMGSMAQSAKTQREERQKKAQERLKWVQEQGVTDDQIDKDPNLVYLRNVAWGLPEGQKPPSGAMKQVMGKEMPEDLNPLGQYSANQASALMGQSGFSEAVTGAKKKIAELKRQTDEENSRIRAAHYKQSYRSMDYISVNKRIDQLNTEIAAKEKYGTAILTPAEQEQLKDMYTERDEAQLRQAELGGIKKTPKPKEKEVKVSANEKAITWLRNRKAKTTPANIKAVMKKFGADIPD